MQANSSTFSLNESSSSFCSSFNNQSNYESTKNIFSIGAIGLSGVILLASVANNYTHPNITFSDSIKLSESQLLIQNDTIGELNMENLVNKDLLKSEKENLQIKINYISSDVSEIKKDMKELVTKSELKSMQTILISEINASKNSTAIWILGGVITVLLAIFAYLFFNPGNAVNIFKAISG